MIRQLSTTALLITLIAIFISFSPVHAQANSRFFPETGHNVSGVFLDYWTAHGGLAQQGYPLTEEITEVSDTNNQTYTVQYFERAVFEYHPENAAPNNVLLSLLGSFLYKSKYPGGAPNQVASTDNPRLFPETGKTIGGKFRAYWEANGGLAQQGYPLTDEFQEVSQQNGQTYTVQYFERAVFELHPENAGTPFEVLLSQLGKFRYQQKQQAPTATAVPPSAEPAPPTATPMPSGGTGEPDCSDIPDNQGVEVSPRCGPMFTRFSLIGSGFVDEAEVGVWATMPNGETIGAPFHVSVESDGTTRKDLVLYLDDESLYKYGVWTITMEGVKHHRQAFGYFKLYPATPEPPIK